MKKKLYLLTILFVFVSSPLIVSANIVCNDGTTSPTCTDCHSGCCSHHGGCAVNSSTDYDDYNYESDDSSNFIGYLLFFGVIGITVFIALATSSPKEANIREDKIILENAVSTSNVERKIDVDKYKNVNTETNSSEARLAIIIFILVALLIVIFVLSSSNSSYDGELFVHQMTETEYNHKINNKEDAIVVIGQTDCQYTDEYEKDTLSEIMSDYPIIIYRFDIDTASQELRDKLNVDGTPTTLFISGGEIKDKIEGYTDYSNLEEKLKQLKFIQ